MSKEPVDPSKFNKRLDRLIELRRLNAPGVILADEARMVLEAFYGKSGALTKILEGMISDEIEEKMQEVELEITKNLLGELTKDKA